MPKSKYSRKYSHKKRGGVFKSSKGAYAPNRYVQSYSGNLQTKTKIGKRERFEVISPTQSITNDTGAPVNQFQAYLAPQLINFNQASTATAYMWQQYRVLGYEVNAVPVRASGTSYSQYAIASHYMPQLGVSGQFNTLSHEGVLALPSCQVRDIKASSTGDVDQGPINQYISHPVVASTVEGFGSNQVNVKCDNSPWLITDNAGLNVPHYGMVLSVQVEGTSMINDGAQIWDLQVKMLIECRYPKPAIFNPAIPPLDKDTKEALELFKKSGLTSAQLKEHIKKHADY